MALRVSCPNGHPLSLNDDKAGKRVRCPRCQTVFVVQDDDEDDDKDTAVAAAPPKKKKPVPPKKRPRDDEDDDDDRPRKRRSRDDDDDDDDNGDAETPLTPVERRLLRQRDKKARLRRVDTGLLLHTIKLWIYVVLVLSVFLMFLFTVVVATAGRAAEQDLSPEAVGIFAMLVVVFGIGALIGVIVAPIIGVVGSAFCCFISKKSDAKGIIVTSFVFDIIPMIGTLLLLLAYFDVFGLEPEKLERFNSLINYGSAFFTLGAWLLFMIFLRQMASYLQKPSLGNEALNLIAYLIIQVISAPITLVMMLYLAPVIVGAAGSIVGIMALFLMTLGWFASFYYLFFVGMIRLLTAMRAEIKEVTG